jgi:hypothetical protein
LQGKTSTASKSGKLGDLIGGIAVVVTLIYLANQIRQNTSTLCTASRVAIYTGYRAQNTHLIDTNVSEAYAAGLWHYSNMPSSQKRVFSHTINAHALFMHGHSYSMRLAHSPKKITRPTSTGFRVMS